MKIEYENRFDDVFLFHMAHQFLSRTLQTMFALLTIFIFWSERHGGADFVAAAIVACFWYISMWIAQFTFNAFYCFSKKDRSVLTQHIVEIQNEAFYEETKYNRSYFFWNGIEKIVHRPGFVAVYISPRLAHIIPRRAFSTREQMSEFISLCKSKMSDAK